LQRESGARDKAILNSVFSSRNLTSGKHPLEKPLGCRLVPTFLQQDIELDAMLIDCSPRSAGT